MRRAALLLLLLAPGPVHAASETLDAVGNIDFRRAPDFKVGDWVRYRALGTSLQGYKTDYTVTILIAGAVRWWGEDCFWVETQTSVGGGEPSAIASLVSYDVFQDSLAYLHYKMYIRKFVHDVDGDGNPKEELSLRITTELTNRAVTIEDPTGEVDTVGVDRVEVPKGTFEALKVIDKHRPGTTYSEGDSTIYSETSETNTRWWSRQVPITSLVRLDVDKSELRRAWVIGYSANAPLRLLERVTGSTSLVDFGSGMKSILFKHGFQHPIAEQGPSPAKPPARPAPRKAPGSGS